MANPKLFGVDIQGIIATAIPKGMMPEITLTVHTAGTPTPGNLIGGVHPVANSYKTRGMTERFRKKFQNGPNTWVESTHRVMLIAKPLADLGIEPQAENTLTTPDGTMTILSVERDPAAATYSCYCRG